MYRALSSRPCTNARLHSNTDITNTQTLPGFVEQQQDQDMSAYRYTPHYSLLFLSPPFVPPFNGFAQCLGNFETWLSPLQRHDRRRRQRNRTGPWTKLAALHNSPGLCIPGCNRLRHVWNVVPVLLQVSDHLSPLQCLTPVSPFSSRTWASQKPILQVCNMGITHPH